MTFKEAYKVAQQNPIFKAHVEEVAKAFMNQEPTACMVFSIGDEAFAYGFDGITIHRKKHTPKRSAYLIKTGQTLEIK